MPLFQKVKHKTHTFISLVKHPKRMILPLSQNGFLKCLSDKSALKLLYWAEMDEHLDLEHPQSFSEKIQWLKLHDHNPEYSVLVDKYLVKERIASKIGSEFIIPTYAVWDNVEAVKFDQLPDAFVIKCNHDSGGLVICRDKNSLNQTACIEKLKSRFKKDAYIQSREWAYKDVKRKIFAEELIVDPEHEDLIDYKFFCFNGKPLYCQVIKDRNTDETIDFYDMDWNLMEFTGLGLGEGPKRGSYTQKPQNYEKMIEIAEKLAQGTAFVRIDLYNIEGRILFGEFTLYPKSGLAKFYPDEWNRKMGDLINIQGI